MRDTRTLLTARVILGHYTIIYLKLEKFRVIGHPARKG